MFETYTRQMLQKLYDELLEAIRTKQRGNLLKRDFQHLADDAFEELRIQLWQYMRTMLPSEREAANAVAAPVLEGFTRIKTGLEGSVIKALLNDQDFEEKKKTLQYRFDVAQHHAWTLTATGTGAANEAKRIQEAIKAGYTHFKFVGPAPEREFCQIHFDKTYSVEEILALDNGHNLNPLYFRGGYNCRHTWVPVKGAGKQQAIDNSKQNSYNPTEEIQKLDTKAPLVKFVPDGKLFEKRPYFFEDGTKVSLHNHEKEAINLLLGNKHFIEIVKRSDTQNQKSFDMLLDGKRTELKTVTEKTVNYYNRISSNFKVARDQGAEVLALYFQKELSQDEAKANLILVGQMIYMDKNKQIMKAINIINKNIYVIERRNAK